jgi:hypothetical protein
MSSKRKEIFKKASNLFKKASNFLKISLKGQLLKPKIVRDVKEIIVDNKSRAKFYHDPKCMKEKTFHLGEQIFAKLTDRQKNWLPGQSHGPMMSR